MRYIVTINNKNYEVEVERGQANIVNTTTIAPELISQAKQSLISQAKQSLISQATQTPAPSKTPSTSAANGEQIMAPLPGTVIDIKVKSGDKVKKGDILFIVEAMKMENEILAPIDGLVVQINTSKGSSVATGDVLAVIQ